MDLITLALAKKFIKDTVNGLGAVKGSPATVKSYDYDDSGNTIVTFAWKDKNDVESTMDALIKKGVKGDSIDSVEVDEDGQIIVILDSGERLPAIAIPITETVATNKKDIAVLKEAVANLSGMKRKVVASLPAEGENNVFYLVPTGSADVYNNYVWAYDDDGIGSFVSLGSTEISFDGYVKQVYLTQDEFDEIETPDPTVDYNIWEA